MVAGDTGIVVEGSIIDVSLIATETASIVGGSGIAIKLQTSGSKGIGDNSDGATVDNAGSIIGDVVFSGSRNANTFTHRKSGSDHSIIDGVIYFGDGFDVFRNAGIVDASTDLSMVFSGLETFSNAGEIRLLNGQVNDIFEIAHDFVGETGSRLSIDVDMSSGTADTLKITGVVSGQTEVSLNSLQPGINTDNTVRIVEVVGDAGVVSADAFILAEDSREIGLFLYELENIDTAKGDDFILSRATQGASVKAGEVSMIQGGLHQLFLRAIPTYHEREGGRQLLTADGYSAWVTLLSDKTKTDGSTGTMELDVQTLLAGVEKGIGDWTLGAYMGGHNGDSSFELGGDVELNGYTLGVYANITAEQWYVDLAIEAQQSDIEYDSNDARIGDMKVDALLAGLALETGMTIVHNERYNLIATGRYLYGQTQISDLGELQGESVDFGEGKNERLEAGLRWEHEQRLAQGRRLAWSLEGSVKHTLQDDSSSRIAGNVIVDGFDSSDTWGQLGIGLAVETRETEVAFIRLHGLVGGNRSGGGAVLGYRLSF